MSKRNTRSTSDKLYTTSYTSDNSSIRDKKEHAKVPVSTPTPILSKYDTYIQGNRSAEPGKFLLK